MIAWLRARCWLGIKHDNQPTETPWLHSCARCGKPKHLGPPL